MHSGDRALFRDEKFDEGDGDFFEVETYHVVPPGATVLRYSGVNERGEEGWFAGEDETRDGDEDGKRVGDQFTKQAEEADAGQDEFVDGGLRTWGKV